MARQHKAGWSISCWSCDYTHTILTKTCPSFVKLPPPIMPYWPSPELFVVKRARSQSNFLFNSEQGAKGKAFTPGGAAPSLSLAPLSLSLSPRNPSSPSPRIPLNSLLLIRRGRKPVGLPRHPLLFTHHVALPTADIQTISGASDGRQCEWERQEMRSEKGWGLKPLDQCVESKAVNRRD